MTEPRLGPFTYILGADGVHRLADEAAPRESAGPAAAPEMPAPASAATAAHDSEDTHSEPLDPDHPDAP